MKRHFRSAWWSAVAVFGCAGLAWGGEGERPLFGFEKEEVEKIPQGRKKIAEFGEDGDFVFFPQEPMLCSQEKASAGRYSCKVVERIEKYRRRVTDPSEPRLGMFRLPFHRLWSLHSREPQVNLLLPQLLNTGGWYNLVFPKDWSGYDLLRVDVCVETADQVDKLMLEVEDAEVEPPVSVTFDAPPAGEWVTLEMDLAKAAQERKLDVRSMAHIWVRVRMKDLEESGRRMHRLVRDPAGKEKLEKMRFRAYVDNIRLAGRGAPSARPVLKGRRSVYTAKLPRSFAVEEHMLRDVFPEPVSIPTEFQPAGKRKFGTNLMQRPTVVPASREMPTEVKIDPPKREVELSKPSAAPIRDMIVKGCLGPSLKNGNIYNSVRLSGVAASDPNHVLIGFYVFQMGSLRAGPTAQVPLGRLCTAAIATLDGGRTWKGLDGKSDWPTVMGGNISKVPPRLTDVGGNIAGVSQFGCSALGGAGASDYPVDMMFFVRSAFTGDGYWKSPKYFVSGDPRHCHNVGSGDLVQASSGRIWGTWAGLDRFSSGRFASVASSKSTWVYCSDDGGMSWSGWRGPGLNGAVPFVGDRQVRIVPYRGQVAVIGQKGWTAFDGKAWSDVKRVGVNLCDAVSCGDEIYVSDETGPVKVYDGREWKPIAIPGRKGGRGQMAVCGWKKVVFVEPDDTGKKLLLWEKEDSEWRGPKELVSEEKPVVQLRAQRYAADNFVPVAYMCTSGEELPKPNRKRTYSIIYGFNQYPPAGTRHEPWIKVLVAPVD